MATVGESKEKMEWYHLNNPGGGGCEGGCAALTPPIFPYLLRRYMEWLLAVDDYLGRVGKDVINWSSYSRHTNSAKTGR
jgi:hypothetical protein